MPTTILRSIVLFLTALALSASAANVDLRWIPPASGGVVGYNVYIAPSTGGPVVSTPIDVGRPPVDGAGVSSATVTGIDRSKLLAIEMTSYDSLRRESVRSNRVLLDPNGESLGAPVWTADFQASAIGSHPSVFSDWGGTSRIRSISGGNSLCVLPVEGKFVTRYLGGASWGAYEISGRVFMPAGVSVAGVAVHVGAANLSYSYTFGSDSRGVFALGNRLKPVLRCAGSTSTGVSVPSNGWVRFRLRYTNPSGRSHLRAKAWLQANAEPATWLADCWTDVPPSSDTGVVAFYRDGLSSVCWDDLEVRPVLGSFDPLPPP